MSTQRQGGSSEEISDTVALNTTDHHKQRTRLLKLPYSADHQLHIYSIGL